MIGMREPRVRVARGACKVLLWVFVGALTAEEAASAACVSNASMPATGILFTGCQHAPSYMLFRAYTEPVLYFLWIRRTSPRILNRVSQHVWHVGTLKAGCELLLEVTPASACKSSTYLLVELWDLGQLMLSNPMPAEDSHRADPLLGMAQEVVPAAVYKGPSSWDIQPPQALFDTVGYELTAHYMKVQA